MSPVVFAWIASRLLGLLFVGIVVAGLIGRARRFTDGLPGRRALDRAGQRFARGEIDAEVYRQLRADLRGPH
jgi:uncharacterized membrane protein